MPCDIRQHQTYHLKKREKHGMRIGKSFIETVNVIMMEKYSLSIQLQDKTQLPGEIYITCNNTVLQSCLHFVSHKSILL